MTAAASSFAGQADISCLGGTPLAAAAARSGELFREVAPWLAALVLVVVVGWVAAMLVRRRLRREDSEISSPLSLEGLRQLHREGKLTDEEFAKAKQAVIDAARRALERQGGDRPLRADAASAGRGPATGPEGRGPAPPQPPA